MGDELAQGSLFLAYIRLSCVDTRLRLSDKSRAVLQLVPADFRTNGGMRAVFVKSTGYQITQELSLH
jgi:hypothetical protein